MRGNALTRATMFAAALATAAFAHAVEAADGLQQQRALLENPNSTPAQRESAARGLVDRHSADAKSILKDALANDPSLVQAAVAKALSEDRSPDTDFVRLLGSLLTSTRAVTEAAAPALANYGYSTEVFSLLQNAANNQKLPEPSRAAVLRAMGLMSDKRVATYLMEVLTDPTQSKLVQDAAADGLGEMTGLKELGLDRQRWKDWWALNQAKADGQWQGDLLINRAREARQVNQRYSQLTGDLEAVLREQFDFVSEAKRSDALLSCLTSTAPELRVDGVKLVRRDFSNSLPISDGVKTQLRTMVADGDRNVRLEVAKTIFTLNDSLAAKPLIDQLSAETDSQVKINIAAALGVIRDTQAIPALVNMLGDPHYAEEAASSLAIAEMGTQLRQKDPATASKVAVMVRNLIDRTPNRPEADELRTACVRALARLKDPDSLDTFRKLLGQAEPIGVRRAALNGLRELGDPRAEEYIIRQLDDPDAGVRLDAALAMETTANFSQAEMLSQKLSPDGERDDDVRAAIWKDLLRLLKNANAQQINGWPDRFKNIPDKRLEILKIQADTLAQAHDENLLAQTRQNIGEVLMSLSAGATTPDEAHRRADEAVPYFTQALTYWRGFGQGEVGADVTLEGLITQTLQALIAAGKYPEAAKFAGDQITVNPQYQQTVGSELKVRADELAGKDPAAAGRLIDEALKMNPPLNAKYQQQLKEIQSSLGKASP